jgi:hypothetical protein
MHRLELSNVGNPLIASGCEQNPLSFGHIGFRTLGFEPTAIWDDYHPSSPARPGTPQT